MQTILGESRMLYHVSRNGQMYGPYTLEDLKRYVASGNVLPTDMVRAEDAAEWVPVHVLLGMPGFSAPAAYPVSAQTDPGLYPDPPNLSWGLVLLFTVLTCGIFIVIWDFVIASWVRRIQPTSQALLFFIGGSVLRLINSGVAFGGFFAMQRHHLYRNHPFSSLLGIAGWALVLVALFNIKNFLEQHYNGPEPLGVRLSGFMTFLFGGLYLQYHLNRINEIKAALRYRGSVR